MLALSHCEAATNASSWRGINAMTPAVIAARDAEYLHLMEESCLHSK